MASATSQAVHQRALPQAWQSQAVALVRSLRPDALESFARLVAATLVQAAATGGAVLEPELLHLAQRDPNRFRRLHQRLQVA